MSHSKLNNLIAALIFLVSLVVYWSTVAPTTSFWDCGEFIACSYILGVPHPPGAPLFVLLGRIFSMLPTAGDIGLRVNLISPIFSAFTAMFTYLIIVRLILLWKEEPRTWFDKFVLYASGVIGALAFAFSDSQWFNSVEAEVYAGSMFFTAIVIWAILKWMDHAESAQSDRYILVIFYLAGLALGVHLLNLLALPTIAMIIFAHRYKAKGKDAFTELVLMLLMAGAGVVTLFVINNGVVKGLPSLMKGFGIEAVVLAAVALLILTAIAILNKKRYLALALMSAVLVVVGYSTYAAIFIRSTLDPAIDENNPDTAARLVSYLNREQYGDWSIADRRAPIWEYQVKKMYVRYFGWQFIGKGTTLDQHGRIVETLTPRGLFMLPFLVGLAGFFYHFYRDWRRALPILSLFFMTGFAIIIYLNQEDPQPRERDYAYTGSFFAFALWIGIGVMAMMDFAKAAFAKPLSGKAAYLTGNLDNSQMATGASVVLAGLLFLAVPGRMFSFNHDSHDRTGNYVAYDYSYNILYSCEPDAILFTNGDNDTFPLWYLQYVEGIRRDVRVVNLSLLNTNWYIKQLKDDEPRLTIRMSDDTIENIQPRLWEGKKVAVSVPKNAYDEFYAQVARIDTTVKYEPEAGMRFEMRPTLQTGYGPAVRVQDLMILKILEDNQFRRPVYFAVTVSPENKIGLDPYLRMDGLTFLVLPIQIKNRLIDPDIMWTNLNEFKYRNLGNPEVYYDDNIQSLLQNYRSAYLHLAQHYLSRNNDEQALQVLDRMAEVMPESVIPTNDFRVSEAIGHMYREAGRPEELDRRYRDIARSEFPRLDQQQQTQFADYLDYQRQPALAESLIQSAVAKSPEFGEGYTWLGRYYMKQRQYSKGIEVLEKWLKREPGDTKAQAQLDQLRSLAKADSARQAEDSAQSDASEE